MHSATQADGARDQTVPTSERNTLQTMVAAVFVLAVLAAIAIVVAWLAVEVVIGSYEFRILPNVTVLGVDLGGLTPDEAELRLREFSGTYDAGSLTFSEGARVWMVPWPEVGLQLDVERTVQAAFGAGRDRRDLRFFLNIGREQPTVPPAFTIDPGMARAALERLAPEVATPPTEAVLGLEGEHFVSVRGQPGWALDVDATLDKLVTIVTYLGIDKTATLTFRVVQPRLLDVGPALARAEELANIQIGISTYDVLADTTMQWTLGREAVVTWLRVEQGEDGSGPSVTVDEEMIRRSMEELSADIGEGRRIQVEDATARVLRAFEAGGGEIELDMVHPTRIHTVQSGDRLSKIATQYGMPPGLIMEANSGVDLNMLRVGQEVVIPSQADLFLYPIVPGKRIVISLEEQRLRVYENDQMLYDWPVSTGLSDSPTAPGLFQILSKEDLAYASQWDLWMPNFMAVYRAGGVVYNGIHALPTLSSGARLWEGHLGSPASYGCIVLGLEEGETLFNWAEIGVLTVIE